MRKFFKWTGIVLLLLIGGFFIAVFSRQNRKFDAPYPDIKASKDSAVIARGQYLVYGIAHCADCHAAPEDYEKVGKGEIVDLKGGKIFDIPPGKFYAKNITSDTETGIGKYSDGELARIFRYGVHKDGSVVLPFMPFHDVSDEDLTAIISYLRSLKPVKNKVNDHEVNIIGKIVKAFVLEPKGPNGEVPKKVEKGITVEYGKYLADNVANCRGCHTERSMTDGSFIGEEYAGGGQFAGEFPGLALVPPNITFHEKTGVMAKWSEDHFVQRFKMGKVLPQTVMPWGPFSRMDEIELRAIYRYLKTVKPVAKDNGPTVIRLDENS